MPENKILTRQVVRRQLFKSGDSVVIAIPREWLEHHSLDAGQKVDVFIDDDLKVLRPRLTINGTEAPAE